ncbi:OapC/ArvC family zinc-ribbon domain-containing protein [Haladaptatus sp. DFWS20]|uniref:Zn-ribbon domain-containing protein n=1 Tax=Haladaptatus sp. DFWS20 TaxID=3403467 RepID=UPI003EC0DAF6
MPHTCTNCGRTFADGSKEMLSGCPDCGGNKFQFQPSGSAPDETTASGSADTAPDATSSGADTTSSSSAVGRAASTVRGWVGSRDPTSDNQVDRTRENQVDQTKSDKATASRGQRPNSGQNRQANRTRTSADESAANSSASTTDSSPATTAGGATTKSPSEVDADTEPAAIQPGEDRAQASARSEVVPEDELPEKPTQEGSGPAESPNENQPSLDELREELNSQFESIKVVEPGQYELNLMELYERDEYIIALKENGRYVIQVPDSWSGSPDS